MAQSLDMRIVEQESSKRLSSLLSDVTRSGPVPEAYTNLALITLVYGLAGLEREPSPSADSKKAEDQCRRLAPRPLCEAEVLVIFALDSAAPEVDNDWFDETFQHLAANQRSRGVWFGSWEVLRVQEMRVEVSDESGGGMRVPGPILDEIAAWDRKQAVPGSLRIVGLRKFPDKGGFAFVIHVQGDSVRAAT
ncbi:MAG TPA: hypothetical protein VMG82_08535 [Candidatus Sulfotelmatobacter sp.]|nr:hypothetical protein [Candidatus Sulfotelmatobacter sp.]